MIYLDLEVWRFPLVDLKRMDSLPVNHCRPSKLMSEGGAIEGWQAPGNEALPREQADDGLDCAMRLP